MGLISCPFPQSHRWALSLQVSKLCSEQEEARKFFLLERRGFLFGDGSPPRGLLAVFHHVELAHVGVLAARELRTWRI